jgi:periplasmic protein TonB
VANGVAFDGWRAHATRWGALIALAAHVTLGLLFSSAICHSGPARRAAVLEVDVLDKRPVPIEAPPPFEPRSEREAPAPRLVGRRPPLIRHATLPPPNREQPAPAPGAEAPQPVFGVTPESVVDGESSVAVPVGNTLMTKDRTPAKAPPAPLAPADPNAFAPVADDLICQPAAQDPDRFVKATYPPEAERLGIEGKVKLRVAVDRHGNVRWTRVIKSAGYGMDEAAQQALVRSKFKPARTCDGRLVDHVIPWTYTFQAGE